MGPRKKSRNPPKGSASKRAKRKRTKGQSKFIGAHVSITGGIWKAVERCAAIGGRSFSMFLGSQRTWKRSPLDPAAATRFQDACAQFGFSPNHILPHGSYLMNCGSPDNAVYAKSKALLVDELRRCSALGLTMFNFHPGSSLKSDTDRCIRRIAQSINYAHKKVPNIITVLENMSCQGSTVGGTFQELRSIIDLVQDKTRIGVCLDTCHTFAAGYDISARGGVDAVLQHFNQVVGLNYLKGVHLNDSKGKLGCKMDRHEDIGRGKIGLTAFKEIVNEPRLDNIPLILETPGRPRFDYSHQIKLLYSFCKN